MIYSTLKTHIGTVLGLDETNSTVSTLLDTWINIIQRDIASRYPWSFIETTAIEQTEGDKTDGTVSVSTDGTTVTGSGTTFTTGTVSSKTPSDWFIQFSGSNNWYRVSSVSTATSLVIQTQLCGSAIAGVSYILRRVFYNTGTGGQTGSTTWDEIYGMRIYEGNRKLRRISPSNFDIWLSSNAATGTPAYYIPWEKDANERATFSLYPFPSSEMNIEVRKHRSVKTLSSSLSSDVPAKWDIALVQGALWLGYQFEQKFNDSKAAKIFYEALITEMKANDRPNKDYIPVLQSIDKGTMLFEPTLPLNFDRRGL